MLRALVEQLSEQLAAAHAEIKHLEIAVQSRTHIGAAIGIIMATLKTTEAGGFAILRDASQTTNRKLRDIADDIIETGLVPGIRS